MSGGGSNTPTGTAYDVDQAKMQDFLKSGTGKAWQGLYNPASSYVQVGDQILDAHDRQDRTQLFKAYNDWSTAGQTAQTNWDNYAQAVAAAQGGENDNTITAGVALSQRNQLLGSLANPNAPTNPPAALGSGLGAFGSVTKKMGSPK